MFSMLYWEEKYVSFHWFVTKMDLTLMYKPKSQIKFKILFSKGNYSAINGTITFYKYLISLNFLELKNICYSLQILLYLLIVKILFSG